MIEEGRFGKVLRAKEIAERKEERAAMMKTLSGECETLIDAIHVFGVTLLKAIRKPLLIVCELLNNAIEFLERENEMK